MIEEKQRGKEEKQRRVEKRNRDARRPDMKKGRAFARPRKLARQEGFEPPTYRFVACCSIQLGYWRTS